MTDTITDADLAARYREAASSAMEYKKELKRRGFDVRARGKTIAITKTRTETVEL